MNVLVFVSIALAFSATTTNAYYRGGRAPECPAEDGEFIVFIPHDDCTKFWTCVEGTPIELSCPEGLEFNPTLLLCDWPEDAGCVPGNGGKTSVIREERKNTRGTEPECPAEDGEFVTHIPHDDCTKFWKCLEGTPVEQNCPPGLEFNPTLYVCDWPANAGCVPGNGGGTGGTGETGEDRKITRGTEPECPAEDGEFVVHIPHDDCTKFYKCLEGTPIEFDCPPGLEFNPIVLVCDWPASAGCVPGNGGGSGGTGQTGEDRKITRGTEPECPAEDGEFVTHIPHDDCTKFWKCLEGTPVEQDCPPGLEFNPTLYVCDWPENAGCVPGNGGGTGGTGENK